MGSTLWAPGYTYTQVPSGTGERGGGQPGIQIIQLQRDQHDHKGKYEKRRVPWCLTQGIAILGAKSMRNDDLI